MLNPMHKLMPGNFTKKNLNIFERWAISYVCICVYNLTKICVGYGYSANAY